MKLILDEHYSPDLARALCSRGYDVVAIAGRIRIESAPMRGMPDTAIVRWAQAEGRVVVTENVGHFMPIHSTIVAQGGRHPGMIFTTPRKFLRDKSSVGSLITALADFIDSHGEADMPNNVFWL